MTKRTIEVFTAGCPCCDDAVALVQRMACPACEVLVYDLSEGCDDQSCREKARAYGVTSVPSVVVDGQLAGCCQGRGVSEDMLRAAGIGASA